MKETLLKAQNFSVYRKGTCVVQDVSFTLCPGEFTALLGLNGSGKSTLLSGVCGLLPATGSCTVNGEQIAGLKERQRAAKLAYLPQRSEMVAELPVLDVVLMGFHAALPILGAPGQAQRETAMQLLERVGMQDAAKCSFFALSEGQRQLVLLARALAQNTPFLLLDEPDSALDFNNRHRMLHLLKDLAQQEKKALLLTMHDANFALHYCDRLLLLQGGRLCGDLRTAENDGTLETALQQVYGDVELGRCGEQRILLKR